MESNTGNNEIAVTALFGTLWGTVELSLGTLIHSLKIPFSGTILAFIAIIIISISRSFINYKGSTLAISSIAAVLKLIILPGFNINPFLAIVVEGIIGEIVYLVLSYNLFASITAGSLILIYTLIHSLIMQGVFFGPAIYKVYINLIDNLGMAFNFKYHFAYIIIPLIISIYMLLGSLAGWLGWKIAKRTKDILEEEFV